MSQSTPKINEQATSVITREEALINMLKKKSSLTISQIKQGLVLQGYPVGGMRRHIRKYSFVQTVCNEKGAIQHVTLLKEEAKKFIKDLTKLSRNIVVPDSVIVVEDDTSLALASQGIGSAHIISVDCEGQNLGETGELCLVQIGCGKKQFLFDMLDSNPMKEEITVLLKKWFEDEKKIKVFHDCRQDSSALYYQYNITLKGVQDTQVMHAFIENQNNQIGFCELCEKYGLQENPYKKLVQPFFRGNQPYWRIRPLTPLMKMYASHDVKPLVKLYNTMLKRVEVPRIKEMNDAINSYVMHFERLSEQKKPIIETPSGVVAPQINGYPTVVSPVNPIPKSSIQVNELDSVTLVDDNSSLAYARHIISNSDTIAVDCEGEGLGKSGQLCLVQIGCESNQFLFDMLDSNPVKAEVTLLLKEWFENEKKIKIFHDCRQDSCVLYHQYNIRLRGVLDTQVMNKFVGANGKKRICFTKLCEKYGLGNPYKKQIKPFFQLNRTYWRVRPLTPLMKMYAAQDVISLVVLARTMLSKIDTSRMGEMNDEIDAYTKHFEKLVANVKIPKIIPYVVPQTNPVVVSESNPILVPQSNPVTTETVLIQQCTEPIVVDEVDQLLDLMPEEIRHYINGLPADFSVEEIVEIAMDVHRPYEVFYYRGKRMSFGKVTFEHINHVAEQLEFGGDNRSGIDGTLHRISSMKNRGGEINGLTLRVGRAVMNIADRLSDITDKTESILLLGHPGTGKTTIMRDIARVMSEKDRVMIVDTSCEIGGFGDTPHQAIGKARRMQVPDIRMQQEVMIQAVQNHTPDVIVIDEIGTSQEVLTARTIAQRGVVLCASAHGNMQSIMKNPILCNLLGGVETVIIGDAAAIQHDNKKVHMQMKDTPIFENIIELSKEDLNSWKVYRDISSVVKKILAGKSYQYELRSFDPETAVMTKRIETVDPLAPQIK